MGKTANGGGSSSISSRSALISLPATVFQKPLQGILLTFNNLTRRLDILLTCHEHQDITLRTGQVDLQHLLDGGIDIVFARRLAVEDFDGEGTTGDGKLSCTAKEARKLDSQLVATITGASMRTFSAFMVADVTISLRSRRRVRTIL